MPIRLRTEDLEFVREVHRLAEAGRNQSEIAEALGMTLGGLRGKMARFSLGFVNRIDVEVIRLGSGERLSELLDTGQIVDEAPVAGVLA